MAEPDRNSPSTSLSSINRESSDVGAASSSNSNSSSAREEDQSNYHDRVHVHYDHHDHLFQRSEIEQPSVSFSYRGNLTGFDDTSSIIRDDTFSCIIVVLTFWFFVSMTMILGVYGPTNIGLGPNSSILIKPNPLFVQEVKVQEVDKTKPGLMLYGFYKSPALDNVTTWSDNYRVSVPAYSHKEWIYFLNEGSQINISYSVKSLGSSIFLIISEGTEGLSQWLENPTHPSSTLSWNIIHGSGVIHQDIFTSSSYYVALGNLNSEEVEVQLDLTVRAFLYNTTEAYYKCTFTNGMCSFSILFPNGNAIVLTSLGTEQDTAGDDCYVKVSYGPRWLTYATGIAGMTVLVYVAFNFLNKFQCTREDGTGIQYGGTESARAPLLSTKDDDLSSWGSSYESISNDEDCLEEFWAASCLEGKSLRDGEDGNNTQRLCAICFDAPRDCFFLPCGHCVACFECGTRLAEAAGTCPVCGRTMKKVRKIFTV